MIFRPFFNKVSLCANVFDVLDLTYRNGNCPSMVGDDLEGQSEGQKDQGWHQMNPDVDSLVVQAEEALEVLEDRVVVDAVAADQNLVKTHELGGLIDVANKLCGLRAALVSANGAGRARYLVNLVRFHCSFFNMNHLKKHLIKYY